MLRVVPQFAEHDGGAHRVERRAAAGTRLPRFLWHAAVHMPHTTHIPVPPLQIWLDIDNSGHYQSCVQTEKGDARMRMPEKARVT